MSRDTLAKCGGLMRERFVDVTNTLRIATAMDLQALQVGEAVALLESSIAAGRKLFESRRRLS